MTREPLRFGFNRREKLVEANSMLPQSQMVSWILLIPIPLFRGYGILTEVRHRVHSLKFIVEFRAFP
jgi:hypothetical protein